MGSAGEHVAAKRSALEQPTCRATKKARACTNSFVGERGVQVKSGRLIHSNLVRHAVVRDTQMSVRLLCF